MSTGSNSGQGRSAGFVPALLMVCLISGIGALAMTRSSFGVKGLQSIFDTGYLVGPTAKSLVEHRGLLVCTEDMGTPGNPICFKSARMPMASWVLWLGYRVFGDKPELIDLAKTLFGMVPIWICAGLILRRAQRSPRLLAISAIVLLLPFFILNYLGIASSLEVEEGYSFSLLAFPLTVILVETRLDRARWAVTLGTFLGLTLLCKSSMLPAALVLLGAFFIACKSWTSRLTAGAIVLASLAGWAGYQHHASGRYTVGTSLDGINFHKGNNPYFQTNYPSTNWHFDSMDWQWNQGKSYSDEWSFNDGNLKQGMAFCRSHPAYTLRSVAIKARVLLISLDAFEISMTSRRTALVINGGMVLFRALFWASVVGALSMLSRPGERRFAGAVYLFFAGAYYLPYLVGFGFKRHALVMAFPAAAMCCRWLLGKSDLQATQPLLAGDRL